jgi:hypothetical protein
MKSKKMTVVKLGLLLGLCLEMSALTASAGVVDSAGTWEGTGASFGADGQKSNDFQIELTNTASDAHTIETQGKITYPDGSTKSFSQEMKDGSGTGFSVASQEGKGGGYCFGQGMCETYISSPDGSAVAVTSVLDGKDSIRTLITVLDSKGQVTEFLREKMDRK